MTMKGKNIAYWTTTGVIAFFIGGGGAGQIAQYLGNPHGVVPVLGYPMYFFAILGFWKVLGAIAILVPGYPRLKEWAYAGIFAPLILTGITVASWALRPESRIIGVLFPATNGGLVETRQQRTV
jgi:uncharacterized membrane protein YphA (DoxX/SURF4 family)